VSNRLRLKQLAIAREPGAGLNHGILPGLLGYELRLAQLAVFRDFERHVGPLGISPGRFGVLVLIEANPGITQSRLALAVGLDRSTMVPVLDDFESRGLVERRRGADRRTNGLRVTVAGKRFIGGAKRRIAAHEQRMFGALSARERQRLFTLLARVIPRPTDPAERVGVGTAPVLERKDGRLYERPFRRKLPRIRDVCAAPEQIKGDMPTRRAS
jgi:DNA-binding MarR family transcriptional regulator